MRVWRISNFANLSGEGGRRAAARWHTAGRPIVYSAQHASTALLEVLVHQYLSPDDLPDRYQYLEIEVPDSISKEIISASSLPTDWRQDVSLTRAKGDAWLAAGKVALLEVPSVVAPAEWNLLINPAHADASQISIVQVFPYPLDQRLKRGKP